MSEERGAMSNWGESGEWNKGVQKDDGIMKVGNEIPS
jgi:hypothetical protein